ncbi:hypothetical protein PMAYCL1PPCAC_13588 [Pristionchus mayeri]|uniref:Calcium binding EGF domain protein n=1 Tax=Pristionchus mayeri TaxID=1317129 RepID=A0AAN4ZRB1_9BILA|nr:hypothetical protein PMAYCL1PPCAC_13588 [Pristionchus mayeri]
MLLISRLISIALFSSTVIWARDTVLRRGTRQLPPLSINSSVPYVFAARLYPFGVNQGDEALSGSKKDIRLTNELTFLGHRYNKITIRRDGCLSLSSSDQTKKTSEDSPLIAPFCSESRSAKVFYRESTDPAILLLVGNEVDIQYRYGPAFAPRSALIITWSGPDARSDNIFQSVLIIGERMAFAHFIYSRLVTGIDPVAGFSSASFTYDLPGSASGEAFKLTDKSDIGIPGEWLFRVDGSSVLLCGPGFKGEECVNECAVDEWGEDCMRRCHCENGDSCDNDSGECPTGNCRKGWTSEPICDEDVNECLFTGVCPRKQPDCMNTPGAYLCVCLAGEGSCAAPETPQVFAVKRVDISPHFAFNRPSTLSPSTTRAFFPHRVIGDESGEIEDQRSEIGDQRAEIVPEDRREFPEDFSSVSFNPRNVSIAASNEIFRSSELRELQNRDHHTDGTRRAPLQTGTVTIGGKQCAKCSPHATCLSTGCVCKPGWKGDGSLCLDVDECTEGGVGVSPCDLPSVCANTRGSYVCLCPIGWEDRNGTCLDIDECRTKTHTCKKSEQCVNTPGTYKCECDEGYKRNGTACEDVDECSTFKEPCGKHAICTNTVGGYECECERGFSRLTMDSFCEDTDECALMSPCHPAATCTNLPGSFHCACGEGYLGNGFDCHETILFPIANDSFILRRANNALATISLPSPIRLCGQEYGRVYLSSNGLISFDRGLSMLAVPPDMLNETAILGLHAEFDYSKQGLVAYTFINQSDSASLALLTRSSLSIAEQFRVRGIRTEHLHIFTFEDMLQKGTDRRNSFQIVIATTYLASAQTFVSFLYERATAAAALAGLSCPGSYSELPADQLSSSSNTARPGHWLMAASSNPPSICPAGTQAPPTCRQDCSLGRWGVDCAGRCFCAGGLPCDFPTGVCASGECEKGWRGEACDHDINECTELSSPCCAHSNCVNTPGSFECVCETGFAMQDGECKDTDQCLARFGRTCHAGATCQQIGENWTCICLSHLVGDGFECRAEEKKKEEEEPKISDLADETPPIRVTEQPTGISTGVLPTIPNSGSTNGADSSGSINAGSGSGSLNSGSGSDESGEIVEERVDEEEKTTTKQIKIFGAGRSRPTPTTRRPPSTSGASKTTPSTTVTPRAEGVEQSDVIFFYLPLALLAGWALMAFLAAFFCCKRRRNRTTAYDGIWGEAAPGPSSYCSRPIYA